MQSMIKKRWFTLVEMLLVVIISGSLFTTIYAIMTTLPRIKIFNDARQQLIEQTNDVMNRFAILFQDYTIDYEEYFNRQRCGAILSRGHYSVFSKYWNASFFWTYNGNYYDPATGKNPPTHYIKYFNKTPFIREVVCPLSYGQYKAMFWDMGGDTDWQWRINSVAGSSIDTFAFVGDADDKDLGTGPDAFWANIRGKVKEIYLISHDGKRRLFLRRNCKTTNICTIQMLKLRGFDAGSRHTFETTDAKTYDGEIDTWACDAGEGFICGGLAISDNVYPNYKLPKDWDDGWIDLFDGAISIQDWTIKIKPDKNPDYAWAESDYQVNPYMTIGITAKLVPSFWERKLWNMLKDYSFTLQTSFDTKSFYTQ